MLICHSCGAPIENRVRQCHHCHNFVSPYAALSVAESAISHPLKIELENQPAMLNRLTVKELIKVNYLVNGHSGNGDTGNGQNGEKQPLPDSKNANPPEVASNPDNYFLSLGTSESPTSPDSQTISEDISAALISSNPETEKLTKPPADFFAHLPNTTEDQPIEISKLFNIEQITPPEKPPFSGEQAIKPNFTADIVGAGAKDNDKVTNLAWSAPDLKETKTEKNDPTGEQSDKQGQTTSLESSAENGQSKDPFDIKDIHRRSFSGNFSSIEANKSKNFTSEGTNHDFASILKWAKSVFSDAGGSDSKAERGKLIALKPWQIGVSAVIILFLLYKGFQAFCGIGGALFANNTNGLEGQGPALSGRWQFAAKWNNGGCEGQLVLHQNGNQIFGQGMDSQYGNYKFNGTRSGTHLDFLKQYYVGNSFIGHTIEFHGDLDPNNQPLFINGNFSKEYMEGGKWRGKPVVVTGIWEAEMVQPLIEDTSSSNFVQTIQKRDEHPAASYGNLFSNLAKHGTWMAAAIVFLGLGGYFLSRALIGPDGWLGIWDKQKYVPAQFMREHKREKKQLSKPMTKGSLPLGQRWEWKFWQEPFFWIPRYLAIPPELRVNSPHVLILGGGEKGKSRLMAHMITHDIESADRALVLVDSDGDLADLLLRWIAAHPNGEQLAQRTVVIDPTSNLPAPAFNPLESPDDHDLQNAASSIVHGFKAIYHEPPGSQNQWSPQTAHILRNCAMLLMANHKTLLDLPTLLQDNDFRDILLEKIEQKRKEKVEYATLLETWGQYKRLARTEQWINWYEPILNRVGPTLINQRLRPILTQPTGDINLKQIIAEKKILIVKIPKGQLHEDANLLGALIVTGMKQAAIALCTDGQISDRTAVMYLDEFDHFIEKETLDAITTETKKFQLGFIGATKTLQHLPEDWRNQIEANIGTMCIFALTKKDGDMLGPRMFRVSGRKAKHRTLMNIFNPINTSPQFELISDEEKYNIDRVLAQSERQFYAYRVGAEAGIFRMHSVDFQDIPDNKVDLKLLEMMYKNR